MTTVPYTHREEVLHAAIHGVGFAAGLVAIPWMLSEAIHTDPWRMAGAAVFGVSALLVLATSTCYHRATDVAARLRWRRLDHAAIYLLIAGTYTPFALGAMRGHWGWTLFAVMWGAALLGVVAKGTRIGFRYPRLSVVLYVLMGWAGIVAIQPMTQSLSTVTLRWIAAGGLLYTVGVPFYVWKSRRYAHALWHVLVLCGVACHFMAVRSMLVSPVGAT